jgi:hypothetical protein
MPDALETLVNAVPEDPAKAHSFSDSAVMERWKEGFAPKTEPEPEVTPNPEPKVATPKKEEPAKAKDESEIPESVLGIKAPVKKEAEELDLLTAEPTGPLKHENYKKLQAQARARVEAEKAARDKIVAEFEEYKGKYKADAVPEDFKKRHDEISARLTQREEELAKIAVERSDMFRERFTNKQSSIVQSLKKTGEELEIKQDTISQLLAASGKRRFEILEEIDATSSAKAYLTSLLKDHDQLEADKETFLSDWKSKAAEMEETERQRADAQKARMKEHEDKLFDEKWNELSGKLSALQRVEGNDKWNAGIDQIKAEAKRYMEGDFEPGEFAHNIIAGLTAERIGAINQVLHSKLNTALAEIENLKAASPSAPPPGGKVTSSEDDSKLSFEDRAKRTFDRVVGSAANNGM